MYYFPETLLSVGLNKGVFQKYEGNQRGKATINVNQKKNDSTYVFYIKDCSYWKVEGFATASFVPRNLLFLSFLTSSRAIIYNFWQLLAPVELN